MDFYRHTKIFNITSWNMIAENCSHAHILDDKQYVKNIIFRKERFSNIFENR